MPQSLLAINAAADPSAFNFQNHAIRIIVRNGDPWFVAADVCSALGYKNASKAVADHLDADERSNEQLDRSRMGSKAVIINESGLYALVLRSRKPEARKFAKWVTSEVLPSIRRTGSYGAPHIDPAALLLDDYPELTLPLPPGVQRALDLRAWKLAGEAYSLIHEHLRRRVAHNAAVGCPKRIHPEQALSVIASGDLGDALAYCWVQKMQFLIVNAQVQARAAADCVAKMRVAISPGR